MLAASAGSVSFFGIPLVRALFGPDDARVAVYFAVLNVPLALLSGAIISSRSSDAGNARRAHRPDFWAAAGTAFRQFAYVPATWALVAGLALNRVPVPGAIAWSLQWLAASVAPCTMFALGLGLHFERSLAPYRMALPAVAIKLALLR